MDENISNIPTHDTNVQSEMLTETIINTGKLCFPLYVDLNIFFDLRDGNYPPLHSLNVKKH